MAEILGTIDIAVHIVNPLPIARRSIGDYKIGSSSDSGSWYTYAFPEKNPVAILVG
jgi:hypothetical protein